MQMERRNKIISLKMSQEQLKESTVINLKKDKVAFTQEEVADCPYSQQKEKKMEKKIKLSM